MIHEIELTTIEALLVVETFRGYIFTNSEDKYLAGRVVDKIVKSVRQDIKEEEQKMPTMQSFYNPILNREDEKI